MYVDTKVNPFLTYVVIVPSFDQILTLNLRNSVKSWIRTTFDGKIRFSIKCCIQTHWSILTRFDFDRFYGTNKTAKWESLGLPMGKHERNALLHSQLIVSSTVWWQNQNLSWLFVCLSGWRKKIWILEVSVRGYTITSDWVIHENPSKSKKSAFIVFQNTTKENPRYPIPSDFCTGFNAALTRRTSAVYHVDIYP